MKRLMYPVAALVVIAGSAFTTVKFQDWKIGEDYSIKFSSEDPSGVFKGLKGTVVFDDKNLAASKFDVTVDVASINTGNGMKNTHAKSAKWFDAEKYPMIKFSSSAITAEANGYVAKGTLEIHGVAKEFSMPFTFTQKDAGGVFNASFDINRMDFKINTEEPAHGAAVVKVDISVPVSKN